ncbi:MAG: PAS domain-containing sensor histidine kinase [Ignavibacteriales bacterium]|nr:PAS domain-containing sensor histidine kinase [Ignavibacteriales bacterium]
MKEKNNGIVGSIFTEDLMENFSLGIFRITAEGRLTFANNSFIQMIGFSSPDDLIAGLGTNDDLRKCFSLEKFSKHIKNNKLTESVENRWIKKNGQSILLKEHINAVMDSNNNVLYYDCMVENVTDLAIIEKLIHSIHITDYSILKALPDLIFVLSCNGVFLECKNGKYQNLFPDTDQFNGHSVYAVFSKEIADKILNTILKALQTGEVETFEFELGNGNPDELKFFEARFVISEYEKVLMILRDITIQKLSEIQIQKFTEELKHLNTTKDKFFSIISHDLRSPINGLLGYAEILANELDSLDKDEIREFAMNIVEISKTTNSLLTNILDWSRVQSGRISFQPEMINIWKSSDRIFNLLSPSASNKNISLINTIKKETFIYADENMIHSILINLTGNAIKFTNNGGYVQLACEENENHFHFTVTDNGIGISKTNIEKLLNSDIIFSSNGTAKEKGTGLGLLLCKEFIEKHSGKIWIESEEGHGTTFNFTIAKIKLESLSGEGHC